MESFLKADIFFFITSVAVIVVGVLTATLLLHMLHVVRDAERLVERARKEGEEILDDVHGLRTAVKKKVRASRLMSFFGARRSASSRGRKKASR